MLSFTCTCEEPPSPRAKRRAEGARTESEVYVSGLALRSVPVATFLRDAGVRSPPWVMPITSINENELLKQLGVSREDRDLIEGLQIRMPLKGPQRDTRVGLTEQQLSSGALARFVRDPPSAVGHMQQRTSEWLLRPFPLGYAISNASRTLKTDCAFGARDAFTTESTIVVARWLAAFDSAAKTCRRCPAGLGALTMSR